MPSWEQTVGDDLYPKIAKVYPELAPKLTGMLLQLGEKECRSCLRSDATLKERLREAMITLDAGGGVQDAPVEEEKRVDPHDGKARTYEQLKRVAVKEYTLPEIEEYWKSMERVGAKDEKRGKAPGSPAKEERPGSPKKEEKPGSPKKEEKPAKEEKAPEPAGDELDFFKSDKKKKKGAKAEAEAPASPVKAEAEAAAEAPAGETEGVPGLAAFLNEVKMSSEHHAPLSKWASENGAATLEEVLEHKDELAKLLELKFLEKSRFLKKSDAALAVVKEQGLDKAGAAAKKPEPKEKAEAKEAPKVADEEEAARPPTPSKAKVAEEEEKPSSSAGPSSSKSPKPVEKAPKREKADTEIRDADAPEYLSFNSSIVDMEKYKPLSDAERKEKEGQDPQLDSTWCFWQQLTINKADKNADYSGATAKVLSFKTFKSFWGFWNHLPQPSALLQGKKFLRTTEEHRQVVEAFMIFKDGVKPEWEDPVNATGGHFQIQLRPDMGGGQIDEYWNNIVMFMIMNQIEPAGMITGVRLVDKLIVKGKKFDNAVIRIEVWFADHDNKENVEQLKHSLERCMSTRLDGTRAHFVPKMEVKAHKH